MIKYANETQKQELKDSKPLRDRYAGTKCVKNREETMKKYVIGLDVFRIKEKLNSCKGCESLIEAQDGSAYCMVEDGARWPEEVKTALKYFFS